MHMQADIPDTSRICISVGLGFYAEATLPEARRIAGTRIEALQQQVVQATQDLAKAEGHAQLVQDGIQGLQQLATPQA